MPDAPRARLLIADHHPATRAQVRQVLGDEWTIAGEVLHGAGLAEAVTRLHPDAIVLDIALPVVDGLESVRRLHHAGIRVPVVLLSVWDDPESMREAMRLGADALVLKDRLATDLATALRMAIGRRGSGRA